MTQVATKYEHKSLKTARRRFWRSHRTDAIGRDELDEGEEELWRRRLIKQCPVHADCVLVEAK